MPRPAHYQTLEYERIRALMADLAARHLGPLRVLDFGCGRGKFLSCFLSLGCDVTGVDANPAYVAMAQSQKVPAFSPEAFFHNPVTKFDVILLSHVIEHLAPQALAELIPRLCDQLATEGRLIIVSPTPGERFYHDFSHVRPYLPQSIRHAFGQTGAPISFGESRLIELVDIYFFKDPYRTRLWRSFYVGGPISRTLTRMLNAGFDLLWRVSYGRIGTVASWLGEYRINTG
jgi:SAM-dependent methyltransferase